MPAQLVQLQGTKEEARQVLYTGGEQAFELCLFLIEADPLIKVAPPPQACSPTPRQQRWHHLALIRP